MALLLSDAECRDLVTMRDAITAVADAYHGLANGASVLGERVVVRVPGGWLRVLPAGLPGLGVVGYKEFHLIGNAVRHTIFLYGSDDGALKAVVDGSYLTGLRTGATAAVAADLLAAPTIDVVGVIGSGKEAAAQLAAFAEVRTVREVRVYSPTQARREAFAREMAEQFGATARPVGAVADACAGSQVLLVATKSHGKPVIAAADLSPGTHVSSIGSTLPEQRELDADVYAAADRVVVDTPQQLTEAGDALAARAAGTLIESRVIDLGRMLAGPPPARDPGAITVFTSLGAGLQDLALAAYAYQTAAASGAGRNLPELTMPRFL